MNILKRIFGHKANPAPSSGDSSKSKRVYKAEAVTVWRDRDGKPRTLKVGCIPAPAPTPRGRNAEN